uniref:PCIF1_WW domain-containing protein n=1 Tax=Macrostomum lignano TaxID=282301 RepID=A0A1I8FMM3_9PLAT
VHKAARANSDHQEHPGSVRGLGGLESLRLLLFRLFERRRGVQCLPAVRKTIFDFPCWSPCAAAAGLLKGELAQKMSWRTLTVQNLEAPRRQQRRIGKARRDLGSKSTENPSGNHVKPCLTLRLYQTAQPGGVRRAPVKTFAEFCREDVAAWCACSGESNMMKWGPQVLPVQLLPHRWHRADLPWSGASAEKTDESADEVVLRDAPVQWPAQASASSCCFVLPLNVLLHLPSQPGAVQLARNLPSNSARPISKAFTQQSLRFEFLPVLQRDEHLQSVFERCTRRQAAASMSNPNALRIVHLSEAEHRQLHGQVDVMKLQRAWQAGSSLESTAASGGTDTWSSRNTWPCTVLNDRIAEFSRNVVLTRSCLDSLPGLEALMSWQDQDRLISAVTDDSTRSGRGGRTGQELGAPGSGSRD